MGEQRPQLVHLPPGICSTAGDEAVELAEACGLVLDPWQRGHVRAMLAQRRDDEVLRWAAMENASIVARQNGKGGIITALELHFLFLERVPVVLHTAHEVPTAKEGFGRLLEVVDGTDELRRQVVRVSRARGDEALELTGGRRLLVKARTAGAGRGLSVPVLVWDEAYALTDEQIAAQLPILAAMPNPWVGYFSSPELESSAQLHRLRRRALSGDGGRLCYLAHGANPADYGGRQSAAWAAARLDPRVWAMGNPALGIRVRHDTLAVLARTMPPDQFDREILGVPDDPPEAGGAALSTDRWQLLADRASEWVGRPAGAVDVSPDGRCSLVLAGRRADGRRHVELVDNRAGTGWVAAERARLTEQYRVHVWVRDPQSAAVQLEGEWRDLKAREWAEASAGFVRAVQDEVPEAEQLRWRCAAELRPALVSAVGAAVMRNRADGGQVWARRKSGADISPVVAATLGWWAAGLPAPPSAMAAVW